MSIQAMTWALEQRDLKDATARHVLLCLANYADKDGRGAFPSANSLSEDTGLSVRTVRYKLEYLEENGFICRGNQAIAAAYIDRHDRRPVVYDVCVKRGATAAPGAQRGANEDATGCKPQHNGVQMKTERGATAAPNPSSIRQLPVNNPKEQGASAPARRAKFNPLTARPGNVSAEVWAEWCQFRKEIGKPLTETMCSQQERTLADHHAPDDVLRLSIGNGWIGIFPNRIQPTGATTQSRHTGFDNRDYTDGLIDNGDGTYGF